MSNTDQKCGEALQEIDGAEKDDAKEAGNPQHDVDDDAMNIDSSHNDDDDESNEDAARLSASVRGGTLALHNAEINLDEPRLAEGTCARKAC